jgi:hypothetical protein
MLTQTLDAFFRRHPRLFVIVVILLTALAAIVLLGKASDVVLVYKAF